MAFSQVWVLRLGPILLGLEPKGLKEVLDIARLTPVPLTPPFLRGLMAHQGQVVPVFDLASFLKTAPAAANLAALVAFEGQVLAFSIDEVVGLVSNPAVRPGQAEPPFFSHVLEEGGRTILLLDIPALFAHLAQAMAPRTAIAN
ncbi:chemotaxis protein CheW [Meiothermus sp. QL-1]|uniref:chemotaxis protein CheW n=1 Tax=Meiothermus sp. QL-1 TaxID=2058095 RepID=UPI000E0C998C|nr:chemotaxis protein CheW [Meiothermus sp. QL-1]RDI96048.1 chemotaxis protein CheW [Meiothermus sp. QL-1]